jgi:hypothetical protein
MEITPEIANKIRETAEKEAIGFYIVFDDNEDHEYNNFEKFLAYCEEHGELPKGCSPWEPFEALGADIDEHVVNHADYIENILVTFLKGI